MYVYYMKCTLLLDLISNSAETDFSLSTLTNNIVLALKNNFGEVGAAIPLKVTHFIFINSAIDKPSVIKAKNWCSETQDYTMRILKKPVTRNLWPFCYYSEHVENLSLILFLGSFTGLVQRHWWVFKPN